MAVSWKWVSSVGMAVGVTVWVEIGVGVAVSVGTDVDATILVGIGVGTAVLVGTAVGVGTAVPVDSTWKTDCAGSVRAGVGESDGGVCWQAANNNIKNQYHRTRCVPLRKISIQQTLAVLYRPDCQSDLRYRRNNLVGKDFQRRDLVHVWHVEDGVGKAHCGKFLDAVDGAGGRILRRKMHRAK